ncbi:MAG: precorrin-3B C(17)-methyltransferase [Dongiaceae bacterium]
MTAIIVLGPSGMKAARRLRADLPGARLHGFAPRVAEADIRFDEVGGHLRELFADGEAIIGICAAGILIRAVAPLLNDKRGEPPVVAVAEDGSVAVPLLGGHHGANQLARRCAEILAGQAAITTAGDIGLGLALDQPPPGWRLGNPAAAKTITASLLARLPVDLVIEVAADECGWLRQAAFKPVHHAQESAAVESTPTLTLPRKGGGDASFSSLHPLEEGVGGTTTKGLPRVIVSDRAIEGDDTSLVLHPATLAVGVGCERGASPAEVAALVKQTMSRAGLASQSVAGIFSIALKAAEPAIHAVAGELGVAARFFDAAELLAETPRLSERSEIVFRETGCWGVAEGAALAAAGPDASLIVSKQRSARATCAIARGASLIDAGAIGRARGRLAIVGIGPGHDAGRTIEAESAIRAASDLVGYRLYLDLLGELAAGKRRHDFALGEEVQRVARALELAAEGRHVALISSGDAGIYAMASLVFELIDRQGNADWQRIEIVSYPGVSAMQSAAARLGAPLGHDFCAISLSDLLTPWTAIEQRVRAAAAGDFVVAFYNPVSQRRRSQLAAARDILLQSRPGTTPVAIARNLGRDGESVAITTLSELDPAKVDMLSIVLVGNNATRLVARPDGGAWLYTPRGYGAKGAEIATPIKRQGS